MKVSTFYEALCPDSMDFIVNQLFPVFNSPLNKSVVIELIPFGKAIVSETQIGPASPQVAKRPGALSIQVIRLGSFFFIGSSHSFSPGFLPVVTGRTSCSTRRSRKK